MGRLLSRYEFWTPITGHDARIEGSTMACSIRADGLLVVEPGFEWDFGSGPAIDTPAVVIASLAHDALCLLTNRRLLPWECRAQADAYYRNLLRLNGTGLARTWWQYAGVRLYSESVARWKDRIRPINTTH
jgi:hypothetical protein